MSKLLAWEDSGQGLAGKAVLVADNPDGAGDFEADVEDIRASFLSGRRDDDAEGPASWGARCPAGDPGGLRRGGVEPDELRGPRGNGGVVGGERAELLGRARRCGRRRRQPLLLTMNCLNGYFVAPNFDVAVGGAAEGGGAGGDRGVLAERAEPRRAGAPVPPGARWRS